ncbi:AAA domain-containing protein, partial [Coemansia mojavensis]
MSSRFGDPYAPTTTITTVRDVSKKALEERERELEEQKQKRVEEKADSDSSSDEDSPGQGGLAGLISLGRSGRTPRRTTKLLPFSEGASADTIKFGGPLARERAQAKQQAKMRLAPSMAALHKHILSWKYDDSGEMPASVSKDSIKKVADQFDSCQQYQSTLEPLFLLECWAQFQKAKEETTCSDTVVAELKSHMCEDQFRELTFEVASADAQALSDGDVLVFAEGISREKQLAQGVRNGGGAKRFAGERTFLAVVKKRQLGRQAAQIVVYVYFEGVQLAQNLNRLVLNSTWEFFSIFGLTPIYREFAALQSLPYLNEALVQEILQPRPTISRALSSMDVRACMKAHSLNQPQAESVMAALQREQGFTLIQGPPGTGKTKTILGLAGALLSTRKPNADADSSNKLLICAPSNAAVDEIVKRLKCGIRDNQGCTYFPRVVRVGQAENISSTVRDTTLDFLTDQAMNPKHEYNKISKAQKRLDEANAELRELDNQRQDIDPSNTAAQMEIRAKYQRIIEIKRSTVQSLDQQRARSREANKAMDQARHNVRMQILQRTDVLCCTLSGSGHELLTSLKCTFDTVIIDEAAQSIELACLIPLKYECERCILVGDPNQLPPTVFSLPATQHLYNQSLFVRIQRNAPDAVNLLSIQYRMHPEISALPSKLFYDSRLKDGPDMASKQHAVWHGSGKFRPFMFFDISGREQAGASHSVFNMDEVNAAVQLVYNLCQDFPGLSWNQKIGVITPYKQQLRRLVEAFRGFFGPTASDAIEFNTVDGFQGQEKEVIIFSCVRAGDAGVGFLADRRRMNVGLTRARKSLFVLGNANKLTASPIWRELISETRTRGLL